MKIEELRSSFTVYLISSEPAQFGGLIETLGLAGYMVATFTELTAAFSELYSNPPHFLIFDLNEKKFELEKAIEQVSEQLPESHIFLISPIGERTRATTYLEKGVYDIIYTPFVSDIEFVRALDRAVERDYFMYMNERLMQVQPMAPEATEVSRHTSILDMTTTKMKQLDETHHDFAQRLFLKESVDDCIQLFLDSCSSLLSCPAVYFRYIQNRRVLIATQSSAASSYNLKELGINFNETVPGFRTVQLREPRRVEAFVSMIQEVFSAPQFFAMTVEAFGEIQGVACFISLGPKDNLNQVMKDWLVLLTKAISLIEAEKRLHVMTTKDLATDVLNRQNFMNSVGEEISRSRRTKLPVALIHISVDQYGQLNSTYGQEESQSILRAAAQILQKHSRVNDVIGRTGIDEFSVILPHTTKNGAMIKAERLRRLFDTADFGKVLGGFSRLTISLGVSEYPSLSRDAEELIQSADEALYQVRKGGNRTCVAKAPENFEPDFVVKGEEV